MDVSPDLQPTKTEDVRPGMNETIQGETSTGAPLGAGDTHSQPVEDHHSSLHGTDPSLDSTSPNRLGSCLTEMDCPICFSRYDIYRVPKELSCKHIFCAVCLKLLTYNEAGTWRIICPICRALTPVFGGLVRTLQNQESLMSRLENPKPKPEVLEPPRPAFIAESRVQSDLIEDERHGNLRIAARRLVILLLILLILLIIIMQFLYTGIMKWVLGFTLAVVVIITILLCFNPYCKMSLGRADNQRMDNSVSTV